MAASRSTTGICCRRCAAFRGCARVSAVPRHDAESPRSRCPEQARVRRHRCAAASSRYAREHDPPAARRSQHDLVVCGHINLLPLAWLASRLLRVPLVLFIYGIDAWQPTGSPVANALARRARWVVSISDVTARKFRTWVKPAGRSSRDCCRTRYTPTGTAPGAKNAALLERYRLEGRKVLMTLGRLVSAERYKGFDEVLEVMPELLVAVPELAYLVVGDGSDRDRLEREGPRTRLGERVVFAGNIADTEKADHYRLADALRHAEPRRGLRLRAAGGDGLRHSGDREQARRRPRSACATGSWGYSSTLPTRQELQRAILEALRQPRGIVPAGLEHFSFRNFEARAHALVRPGAGGVAATPRRTMSTALILGISGQDGAYLARLLLGKGYTVVGGSRDAQTHVVRRTSSGSACASVSAVESVSLNDFRSVIQTLSRIEPDEVYNLAGQSSVALSFAAAGRDAREHRVRHAEPAGGDPVQRQGREALQCGIFGMLRRSGRGPGRRDARRFVPGAPTRWPRPRPSGRWPTIATRTTCFACSGILFNHESPLRPERFVTRKVIAAACRIARGAKENACGWANSSIIARLGLGAGLRRSDVADAAAGGAGRLTSSRRGDATACRTSSRPRSPNSVSTGASTW